MNVTVPGIWSDENVRDWHDGVTETMQQLQAVIANPIFLSLPTEHQNDLARALGVLIAIRRGYDL
jgi:hypothetical protein